MVGFSKLMQRAFSVVQPRALSTSAFAGSVGCALLAEDGLIYTGVNIDTACSMGFCAEHAAISAMISAGSSQIIKIVAVKDGEILSPCGRCREFMSQINDKNFDAKILVAKGTVVNLKALLPYDWK